MSHARAPLEKHQYEQYDTPRHQILCSIDHKKIEKKKEEEMRESDMRGLIMGSDNLHQR